MTVLFARLVLYCIGGGFAPDFSTHVVPRLAGENMGHPSKGGRLWEPWDLGGRRGALQIPPLRSPGFPVELRGVGALHAPFPNRKAHTRLCLVERGRKSEYAPVGMTKGGQCFHGKALSISAVRRGGRVCLCSPARGTTVRTLEFESTGVVQNPRYLAISKQGGS